MPRCYHTRFSADEVAVNNLIIGKKEDNVVELEKSDEKVKRAARGMHLR